MPKLKRSIFLTCNMLAPFTLLIAITGHAQETLIAPLIGSVSGQVQAPDGSLVEPTAAIDGTILASIDNGSITASIEGSASCTGGLGIHFTFAGQYDSATGNFSAQFSDTPGFAPDTAADIVGIGNNTWQVSLSGKAPSDTGERDYDLQFEFQVPETAIFPGGKVPAANFYSGTLNQSISVPIDLNNSALGLNQSVDLSIDVSGSWDATSIPRIDSSADISGEASGTISSNSVQILVAGATPSTLEIPVTHTATVPVPFQNTQLGVNTTVNMVFEFNGTYSGSLQQDSTYSGSVTGSFSTQPYSIASSVPGVNTQIPLSSTQSISLPIVDTATGVNTTAQVDVTINGSGTLVSNSGSLTGQGSGSFSSSQFEVNAESAGGNNVINLQVNGSFGGSLFTVNESTLAFKGAWVATGANQNFGGDIDITVPLADTSTFPFSFSGVLPIATGNSAVPQLNIPLNFSGSFPLNLDL